MRIDLSWKYAILWNCNFTNTDFYNCKFCKR
ncbi:pentapeptide repeat-containing protein [Leptotrichia sp. oral taxon 215]